MDMTPRIAEFYKVSYEQYKKDCVALGYDFKEEELREQWESIQIPTRATSGSAGYDFYSPFDFSVGGVPNQIPTGIRCAMDSSHFLMCCPKSGLGFKYGLFLQNTVGIIDSDYFNSDNEGHIQAKFTADVLFHIKKGQKFMQGIFIPYGITDSDHASGTRNGGFGSTGA